MRGYLDVNIAATLNTRVISFVGSETFGAFNEIWLAGSEIKLLHYILFLSLGGFYLPLSYP